MVTEADYVMGNYNIYTNLLEKKSVCEGFAKSFYVLTRLMGMDSLYQEDGNLNHAWNYVKLMVNGMNLMGLKLDHIKTWELK